MNIKEQSVPIRTYLTRENALNAYELLRSDQSMNKDAAASVYKLTEELAIEQRKSDENMIASMSEKSSARAIVQSQIDSNKVVVYSKSYCPYCAETKKLLQEMEVNFLLVELDQLENGDELQDALAEITGQRTVPNIFIRGKSVGGNSDLKALHKKGTLVSLLEQHGKMTC